MLIAETKETNEKMGKSFDIAASVSQQLPFFSCMNIVLNRESQRDISQYLYCKEFNISPFSGDYGMQPYKWINKIGIMKVAMNKREERMQRKSQMEAEREKV